ncbi:protein TolQ [Geobacter sulfurreducens]|uniref:Biopolymer transport membrane proton channel, TolQ-related protein n=1 Tax=Geobacter sulfurreducens (strain ATCC 51573 / DSM 12127 / PCA) TaxID=243231 RepID=Q74H64_GEOSL|nr:protein TolQ [Geobacter sulfurreducens]BET59896.1 protein TolQ [Geobacter sp. 60473]AAR33363.1 biopolymer transport membrane proton channel, TolQ-related protein [Geobacter sulfurreducens PCA]ADI82892.1 biopolymer transport membrane proton channel, TolQ-related [Geobacter sulfurreducens KN400]AJY69743.1 flagellar motor protein MotA [Geobacter sulfurreducens]QVW35302.1 protein TolQ [Geobacter sulfurreducens]
MTLFAGTGLVVKLVLVVLIFFSVVSWAIIFFKLLQINRANGESDRFLDFFWKTKRFDAISSQLDRFGNSPLSVLFNEGYAELRRLLDKGGEQRDEPGVVSTDLGGIDNIARALRRATTSEITRLEKYVTFLATTGSTAPFIGLFGTVWGIMNAFKGIGETGSASLAVVAPGIAEALIATAIGLVAAIPAVMAYNHFQHKIKVLIASMDNFSTEFLNIVQRTFAGK